MLTELSDEQIKFLKFVIKNYKRRNTFGYTGMTDRGIDIAVRIFENTIRQKTYKTDSTFTTLINSIKKDYDEYLTLKYIGTLKEQTVNPCAEIFMNPQRNYVNP